MNRLAFLPLAALALVASPAAAEVQVQSQGPVVALSVYEQVEVEPDVATVGTGVTTDAPTAVEALRRNSAEMERLVGLIRALGVPARDIQTARITLNARYDYNNRNDDAPPRFIGYRASNQVTVKLRDLTRVGPVLDQMVGAGATNISGPEFAIENDAEAKAAARRAALERGRMQAEEYARAAGYSGVRLIEVSEVIRNSGGPVERDMIVVTGSRVGAASAPPVAPGVVAAGVAIALTYEMTR